ncbi:MAG: hypothetical protein R3B40_29860 [Polyangiales bacterium]
MTHRGASRFVRLACGSALALVPFLAGCGRGAGAATTAQVTTPAAPVVEPRNATGQLLEDFFFQNLTATDRFDLDAALDEGGGSDYYDEEAAGPYYDETAAGAEDDTEATAALVADARALDALLVQLQDGLAAEQHELANSVDEVRSGLLAELEHPEDGGLAIIMRDAPVQLSQWSLATAELYVNTVDPRPHQATDCSVGTIALYIAVYDALIEASADAHVQLNAYLSDQDAWLMEQQQQLSAAQALLEWLDSDPPIVGDGSDAYDRAWELADGLYDVDAYLTEGTAAAVSAAMDSLGSVETNDDIRAAFGTLRAAVLGTLANVQQPPYRAEIAAYQDVPEQLRAALDQLPNPGPRAALAVLGRSELRAGYRVMEWEPEQLDEVSAWARTSCEGAPRRVSGDGQARAPSRAPAPTRHAALRRLLGAALRADGAPQLSAAPRPARAEGRPARPRAARPGRAAPRAS